MGFFNLKENRYILNSYLRLNVNYNNVTFQSLVLIQGFSAQNLNTRRKYQKEYAPRWHIIQMLKIYNFLHLSYDHLYLFITLSQNKDK